LGAAEGKLANDNTQVGLASDTTRTDQRTSRRGSNDPIVENSLQTPGLQLDEATVDFLTKLPLDNSSSGSNSEE
jgi:hypothetical protein